MKSPSGDENRALDSASNQRHRELEAAEVKYRQFLQSDPQSWDALYLHGTTLLQLGRFRESIEDFSRAAALRPEVPDVHNNLGVAYQALDDWEHAARSYQAAIQAQREFVLAVFNLGRLLEGRGRIADAENCFRRAVELKPTEPTYHLHLAGALGKQNNWLEAERVLWQAVANNAENLDLRVNWAHALLQLERLEEAAQVYRDTLRDRPGYPEIHSNLGFVLERQGRLAEALAAANSAIELRPDYAEGLNNLGIILRSLHRLDDACGVFRRALKDKPDFALAEFNLGTTHLLAERYREGWPGYRLHARIDGKPSTAAGTAEWDGRPIPGNRLLVYADQGFGDTIQFARFLPAMKDRSKASLIFRCQPALATLFAASCGADEVVAEGTATPTYDAQISLASLPGLLEITIENVGAAVPYIHRSAERSAAMTQPFPSAPAGARRIGLVWQGNPRQPRDIVRSCPLQKLLPLLDVANIVFYSLQTGEIGRGQLAELALGGRVIDLGSGLADFAQTAALLSHLDLLLTVDTAIAHLAGAMGHAVWTMLCHTPDWRWHLDRCDSPWYPTMRLFRQPRWGDWDAVVAAVRAALATDF